MTLAEVSAVEGGLDTPAGPPPEAAATPLPLGEHKAPAAAITEPSLSRPDLFSEHPLGTNNFGLDELARVIYGARASLLMALTASAIGLVIGGAIGIVAGT